ncbi:NADH oxidase [Bdellovibrio bacteriovorus]|uniref:NADH:flavin oxidoreductase n=1 Tax=Bdellovibrio bacteriovorus TaxID=959 RepID=UPI00045C1843|nr:NADH:flavin oxidoreductase [Bdellovibrio bacteriovorus]AHZ85156.1 1,2-oxophytodienoate reductase [Bdellovibrio bacteriovorus]BEV69046.1 NADH oxidase [Bdellovibrio bacteriovorus]
MNNHALFQPFQFKGLTLKNRIVMAPMTRQKSPDGVPTEDVAKYYQRRAEGEVGLILSEGTVINRPASSNEKDVPHFHGEKSLHQWQAVIQAVHSAGGKMAPQIWHMGKMKPSSSGWLPKAAFEGPAEMTLEDIQNTINAYAQAALDAKNLGFDTVELHGAHGYLIDQFFWPGMNTRTDRFGGNTIAARNTFAVEVVKAVRAKVGADFPVILRLSQWKQQDYNAKVATTPKEMEEWLLPLSEAGVDIFHCSQRRFWEPEFADSDLNFAGWAKKITGKPTITVGSIGLSGGDFLNSFRGQGAEVGGLEELTRRLDRGDFDLVAVGRALLTDSQWVKKVKEARTDELKGFNPADLAVLT